MKDLEREFNLISYPRLSTTLSKSLVLDLIPTTPSWISTSTETVVPLASSSGASGRELPSTNHRYYTEGIGNGSRAAIHCIILASGRQCSINQHRFSDHVTGTFSKSKDI